MSNLIATTQAFAQYIFRDRSSHPTTLPQPTEPQTIVFVGRTAGGRLHKQRNLWLLLDRIGPFLVQCATRTHK